MDVDPGVAAPGSREDIEAYDDIRICRLNRIKIKNPKDWDQAKYDDFVENDHIMSFKKK